MLKKIAPILQAINLTETNLFYKSKLKFLSHYYGNYLIVIKEDMEIHFVECKDPKNFIAAACCLFDNNIEDLYAKCCSMDMIMPGGNLKNNPRGKKEFCIVDNNGNELRFCEL